MTITYVTPFANLLIFPWPFNINCKYMYIEYLPGTMYLIYLFLLLLVKVFSVCFIILFYYFTFHSSRYATLHRKGRDTGE